MVWPIMVVTGGPTTLDIVGLGQVQYPGTGQHCLGRGFFPVVETWSPEEMVASKVQGGAPQS